MANIVHFVHNKQTLGLDFKIKNYNLFDKRYIYDTFVCSYHFTF